MSESESADPTAVAEDSNAKAERKRVRHRKKQLYERILRQMEFYFSDANLTKDRYLGELTRTDPDVPIEVFLKFNKIRAMTHDVADIAKALRSSELLICTHDNQKVRRKEPLRPYDSERRTIYVESVPAMASRDWLQTIFKDYGPVAYISLPKFKDSQRIKGFAFVEFEQPEDAQKCLSAFTKMGCKLPTCMAPEELTTIKMFEVDQPPDDSGEQDEAAAEKSTLVEGEKEPVDNMEPVEGNKKTKSKQDDEERKDCEEPPRKKQKRHKKSRKSVDSKNAGEPNVSVSSEKDASTREDGTKSLDTSMEEEKATDVEHKEAADTQDDATETEDSSKKKKSRKRTAKERNKPKSSVGKNEAPTGSLWGLQVLSKTEWRVLRNKYLNLQRKRMKELKTSLRMRGIPHSATYTEPQRRDDKNGAAVAPVAAAAAAERVDGVFVSVELPEPCLDVRLTKRQVRSNVHVQHVDVKEGQREMIVRFDTPDAADQYCSSGIYASARVLRGAEGEAQWERAAAARGAGAAAAGAAGTAARRARGRTRLLQRAAAAANLQPAAPTPTDCLEPDAAAAAPATHLRFDD